MNNCELIMRRIGLYSFSEIVVKCFSYSCFCWFHYSHSHLCKNVFCGLFQQLAIPSLSRKHCLYSRVLTSNVVKDNAQQLKFDLFSWTCVLFLHLLHETKGEEQRRSEIKFMLCAYFLRRDFEQLGIIWLYAHYQETN